MQNLLCVTLNKKLFLSVLVLSFLHLIIGWPPWNDDIAKGEWITFFVPKKEIIYFFGMHFIIFALSFLVVSYWPSVGGVKFFISWVIFLHITFFNVSNAFSYVKMRNLSQILKNQSWRHWLSIHPIQNILW